MPYCSFYAYQSLPLAGFVLLKVVRSEHFAELISHEIATARYLLESCIRLMRVMSVSDNDLALRLSDVLAYLYNHPNPRVVNAEGRAALQLNIQSRLSLSIVFDSLWRWRDQFRHSNTNADGSSALMTGMLILRKRLRWRITANLINFCRQRIPSSDARSACLVPIR